MALRMPQDQSYTQSDKGPHEEHESSPRGILEATTKNDRTR